ncbi:MAG: hypothetical protein RLZZ292_886 [Bacteroidota bacterium]|jgi:ABC-type uncharacterized transport system permease subunit
MENFLDQDTEDEISYVFEDSSGNVTTHFTSRDNQQKHLEKVRQRANENKVKSPEYDEMLKK